MYEEASIPHDPELASGIFEALSERGLLTHKPSPNRKTGNFDSGTFHDLFRIEGTAITGRITNIMGNIFCEGVLWRDLIVLKFSQNPKNIIDRSRLVIREKDSAIMGSIFATNIEQNKYYAVPAFAPDGRYLIALALEPIFGPVRPATQETTAPVTQGLMAA